MLRVCSDLVEMTQDVQKIMERLIKVWVWEHLEHGGRVQGTAVDVLDAGWV